MATRAVPTAELARRFAGDGFFVLEGAVPASDLALLRQECDRLVGERDREMDRLGVDAIDLDQALVIDGERVS